jgi:hypothetical protein
MTLAGKIQVRLGYREGNLDGGGLIRDKIVLQRDIRYCVKKKEKETQQLENRSPYIYTSFFLL